VDEVSGAAGFSSEPYHPNSHGKGENPDGHNSTAKVTLVGELLNQTGLILLALSCWPYRAGFMVLALSCWPSLAGLPSGFRLLLQSIVDHLDHPMINHLPPFTGMNPPAENLARYFLARYLLERPPGANKRTDAVHDRLTGSSNRIVKQDRGNRTEGTGLREQD